MKQQCHLSFIYISWAIAIGGLIVYLLLGRYIQAGTWIIVMPLAMWLYVKYFPALSTMMGYGSVEDQPASEIVPSSAQVTLYTGIGCPFCPIVKKRLLDLQTKMGFSLKEIDVTLKPELITAKGIRALPVIEVGGRLHIGNATSEQMAAFISGKQQDK